MYAIVLSDVDISKNPDPEAVKMDVIGDYATMEELEADKDQVIKKWVKENNMKDKPVYVFYTEK